MGWSKNFIDYGLIKNNGDSVKVHSDSLNGHTIWVGKKVTNAYWSGDSVIITTADGETRRYRNYSDNPQIIK